MPTRTNIKTFLVENVEDGIKIQKLKPFFPARLSSTPFLPPKSMEI